MARLRHKTTRFFAQEGASNKDETNVHQYIASQDPTWYQQYVVDILGKEYTESNLLQMNLEVATSLSFPKMERDRGVKKIQASTDEMDVDKASERAEEQTRRQMMGARLRAEKDRQEILQKSQENARRAAEEEAQKQMEERQKKLEARLKAQEQARVKAEAAKEIADELVKRLEARLKAEEEANAAAEEARMLADEANRKAEEVAKAAAETTRLQEEEVQKKTDEREAKVAAEEARMLADEANRKAEEVAEAAAEVTRLQEEEVQKKTDEQEAKVAAEEARILADEIKRKTEQQERAATEKARVLSEKAKQKAKLEAERAQEMAKQAKEEAKQKADKEAIAARAKALAEEAKIRAREEVKRLEAQEQKQLLAEDAKNNAKEKSEEEEATVKAESKSPITTNTTSTAGPASPRTTPTITTAESDERVAVFQDMGEKLKSIPLKDLLALGYRTEEIKALQADALAVIVNDEIKRPRVGVPPQWRIPSNAPDRQRVRLVDNAEQAQQLVESDQVERQRKRAAKEPTKVRRPGPTQPSSSKDATRGRDPPQVSSEERLDIKGARERRPASRRRPVGSESDLDSTSKSDTEMADEERPRRRRPLESEEEFPGAPRARRRAPPTDEEGGPEDLPPRRRRPPPTDSDEGSRRRRRSSTRGDGTPKRIYSARESKPSRSQNPNDPPDSSVWMDMDTFRDMLRSEAELRLRVLGDDWAPTVKQESDWRLNLYKDWLWALHNGVGTNAVVPSSRYDRARKMGERRQREKGNEMPSSRPKRRPRRDDGPPESR